MVRGTFSPARAWRPAVVARLARTLGHRTCCVRYSAAKTKRMQHASLRPALTCQESEQLGSSVLRAPNAKVTGQALGRQRFAARCVACVPDFEGQLVEPAAIGSALPSLSLVSGGGRTAPEPGANPSRMGKVFMPSLRSIMCAFVPVPLWPNPSLKRSANGRPPSPGWWYAVHFHQPGLGVLPSSPA